MSLEETFTPRPRHVYLLVHPMEPLRRDAVDRVAAAAHPHIGLEAFNSGTFRAPEGGRDGLNAARTLPMMAAMRLVQITHLEEANNAFFAELLDYLKKPSETTCLVLIGAGFPKVVKGGKRWSQAVKKALGEHSWTLDRKASLDVRRFIETVASRAGKGIESAAARSVVQAFDGRLGVIEQEVLKLALYAEGASITSADVAEVTRAVPEAAIWDLTRAILARNADTALALVQRLQTQGNDSRQVLGTITWKLRSVAIAANALRKGASDSAASKAAGLKTYELRNVKAAIRSGLPSTEALMGSLARANLEMNSHRAGDRRILERLVLGWVRPVP